MMGGAREQGTDYTEIIREKLRTYNANRPSNFVAAAEKWDVGAQSTVTGFAVFIAGVSSYSNVAGGEPPVPPDKIFDFSGPGGGALFGGGSSWGRFWCFIDRAQLPGASGFTVEMAAAATSIQFYRDGLGLIGHFLGGGLAIGGGLGGGSGIFRLSPPR